VTTPSSSQSRRSRSPWTRLAAAVPLGLLATVACSDSTSTTTPATYITADLGNAQTGTVQTTLPDSLTVLVTDVNNNPLSGITVTWTGGAFAGVPSSSSVVTNSSGLAKVAWLLGSTADTGSMLDSMTASIATSTGTISAVFTAIATPGPVAAITAVTPLTASTGTAGVTVVPLQVRVIDQYNNPVSNATVTWSLVGAGTLSNTTTTTIVSGIAAVNWTLGSGSGTVTATVAIPGGTTQTATFTGTGS
jgi:adhesin/invasin